MSSKPATTWGQRLALVAFGLALVGLLELGLRLFGFGGHPEVVVPLEGPAAGPRAGEARLYQLNPAFVSTFFGRAGPGGARQQGSIRPEKLLLPKPEGTLRVLFLGESTVEGFPMPRNLTSSAFLEVMIQQTLPERRVEVVNLGVTAVASFPIRKLAERAIDRLEGDAVVLYGAHNELYGASGQASSRGMGRRVATMRWVYALRGAALYQALEGAFAPRERPAVGEEGREAQLIQVMAARAEIEPGGALHAAARRSLEANFAAVVRRARRLGLPAVVATVASNERDLEPIASWRGDLPADVDAWGRGLAELRAAAEAGDTAARVELARRVERAPSHAAARFAYGRALEAAGERAAASEQYRLARDLDAGPWRAGRDKNRVLRELARREGAILADCEKRFAETSAGATSWRLFDDHVHPSLEGQALLARTVFEALAGAGLLGLGPEDVGAATPWREIAAGLGANLLERYRVVHMMATLFRGPPLGVANPGARERFERHARELRDAFGIAELEAIALWQEASEEAGEPLPISFFALAHAVRRAEPEVARRYARGAVLSSEPLSDERSATHLLEALADRLDPRDPEAEGRELLAHLAEARKVAGLLGQPTALHAAVLSGLYTLTGDLEQARSYAALRAELTPSADPRTAAYLRQVPQLTQTPEPSTAGLSPP